MEVVKLHHLVSPTSDVFLIVILTVIAPKTVLLVEPWMILIAALIASTTTAIRLFLFFNFLNVLKLIHVVPKRQVREVILKFCKTSRTTHQCAQFAVILDHSSEVA